MVKAKLNHHVAPPKRTVAYLEYLLNEEYRRLAQRDREIERLTGLLQRFQAGDKLGGVGVVAALDPEPGHFQV
jgi:hypothetical protein